MVNVDLIDQLSGDGANGFLLQLFFVALNHKVDFAGTSADDLFPLFDRYGKVVDIFIPRDRRYCVLETNLLH